MPPDGENLTASAKFGVLGSGEAEMLALARRMRVETLQISMLWV
jgi:hypothetical protein